MTETLNRMKNLISGRLKKRGRIREEPPKERVGDNSDTGGGEAKKGEKAQTKTWSHVVKVLKIEDELETTNSDKSGNESETPDSETWSQLSISGRQGRERRAV